MTMHLPECHSLKEKRQIVKSLVTRTRNQFNVAMAEVADNDRWQIAQLGIVCVSNNSRHVDEILAHVRQYIENIRPDLVETDIMHW
jgi:uncharacterized protein YlxP (DUF503 family)